jgi:hypothetical protein
MNDAFPHYLAERGMWITAVLVDGVNSSPDAFYRGLAGGRPGQGTAGPVKTRVQHGVSKFTRTAANKTAILLILLNT